MNTPNNVPQPPNAPAVIPPSNISAATTTAGRPPSGDKAYLWKWATLIVVVFGIPTALWNGARFREFIGKPSPRLIVKADAHKFKSPVDTQSVYPVPLEKYIHITITNSGTVPARDVRLFLNADMFHYRLEKGDNIDSATIIKPNDEGFGGKLVIDEIDYKDRYHIYAWTITPMTDNEEVTVIDDTGESQTVPAVISNRLTWWGALFILLPHFIYAVLFVVAIEVLNRTAKKQTNRIIANMTNVITEMESRFHHLADITSEIQEFSKTVSGDYRNAYITLKMILDFLEEQNIQLPKPITEQVDKLGSKTNDEEVNVTSTANG